MTEKSAVDAFVSQRVLALAGLSRKRGKFGNMIYKELTAKGYTVYPVHPTANEIRGIPCFPNLGALPAPVGGLILVVPPAQSEALVREAHEAGITRIWMQQGAESEEAIRYCEENGMSVVHHECIMMFAEPVVTIHRFHRWLWGLIGRLPK